MAKKYLFFTTACAMFATLALSSASVFADGVRAAPSHANRGEFTDQIIVRLKDETASNKRQSMSITRAQALSQAAGANLQPVRPTGATAQVVKLPQPLPMEEVQKITKRLMENADVAYAEPDRRKYPHRTPTDTRYNEQWYLYESVGGINAAAAWDITTGSSSIVVAVIDGGVVSSNSELQGRLLLGYDFISADTSFGTCVVAGCPFATANDGNGRDGDASDPGNWITAGEAGQAPFQDCTQADDSSWHGTHVAGIIGALSDNGTGVTGLDWQARILPVRVIGKCGGYTSDIVDGMRWAAGLNVAGVPVNSNPARVLNVSLGGVGACSNLEQNAINEILSNTNVKAIVTSAGNEHQDASQNSPGNCNGVINVGATDRNGNFAPYSDFGAFIAISAPGGVITTAPTDTGANAILSLNNNGTTTPTTDAFAFFSGTSAAAPQVSAAISLMLAVNPSLTSTNIRNILVATARQFPTGSNCTTALCGAGILDVQAAVRRATTTQGGTNASSSSGSDGGGGGGCVTGSGTADIGLLFLVLMALLGLRYRKQ